MIAIAIMLLMPMTAAAQDVTEPALKAAFIYNFAKFTEWPADAIAAGAPLVLCVLGDAAIGGALERAVKGRTLAGHSIGVSQAAPDGRPLDRVPHRVRLRRDSESSGGGRCRTA